MLLALMHRLDVAGGDGTSAGADTASTRAAPANAGTRFIAIPLTNKTPDLLPLYNVARKRVSPWPDRVAVEDHIERGLDRRDLDVLTGS